MSPKKKMAYIMHVDWDWIKQRPHFLFEELTKYFEIDLYYIQKIFVDHKIKNPINTSDDIKIFKYRKLPFSGRSFILKHIERIYNADLFSYLHSYDYIWVTSPLLFDFLPSHCLEREGVVYDCMDLFVGFYNEKSSDKCRNLEKKLVNLSDIIFTSSIFLKEYLISNYNLNVDKKILVVNNAISNDLLNLSQDSSIDYAYNAEFNIMYMGTIGRWIDFNTIMGVLERLPNVSFTFIGPIDTDTPKHSRIKYIGPIEHHDLFHYAQEADAFIMPFKITDLVRAVDPVKIYEYISFCKPIFSINYNEMHKFRPFVNLYSNTNELLNQILLTIKDGQTYTSQEAREFLQNHTWEIRGNEIAHGIYNL